ncbi:MAG: cysteine synthase A [Ruminococcaceae bacterium]|nr:cysteine synthase A [Oscillospiraceae bacterium]
MIYRSVEELIGNTPLLLLSGIKNELGLKANIFAKLEFFNPAGSIKDRAALKMITDAEKSGLIKPGYTLIEPTSGNTGIGIAAIGVARGYKVKIVMPDTMSVERIKLIKAYGAEVVLTDGKDGMKGAINKAEELVKEDKNSIVMGQFTNPSNPLAHYETTGPEIWKDTSGKIDYLVSAIGTGGTITGTGSYLKEKNPNIKIIGVEPADSPVLSGGKAGPHKIQGIGAGFVPEILNLDIIDEVITVSNDEAYNFGRNIAVSDGVLVGISSGAALTAAVKLAKREDMTDKNIVVIFSDTGSRYLSTPDYF